MTDPSLIAAVDLGSNSFHLIVARVLHGELVVVDRLRETTRLAAGLDRERRLDPLVVSRALTTLTQFGQRIREVPRDCLRVVGTATLRRAANADQFMDAAAEALGVPIEVLSGREEARLIYLGVAHSLEVPDGRRLVVDIGGGSTEVILGERFEPMEMESADIGCVTWTAEYFADGELKGSAFRAAETAAGLELQHMARRYRNLGWDEAVGASGTVEAIEAVLRATGWSKRGITARGLAKLREELIGFGKIQKIDLPGLRPDRVPVFPAGVAILSALFGTFDVRRMMAASGALREGVLYDLLGRIRHEDLRDRTVLALAERWHVDAEQAARVERTALHLLRQVVPHWIADEAAARQLLGWAARLHEVGQMVAHGGYHKHSAYLVANADMAGFSRDDQELLASLLRVHRRKLATLFRDTPPLTSELALRLAVLLRLAFLLHRSRTPQPLPQVALQAEGRRVTLSLPLRWLDDHSLVAADLLHEVEELSVIGLDLVIKALER